MDRRPSPGAEINGGWGLRHRVGLPLVFVAAIAGTALMVMLDAFDWFYRHSRRHEAYGYDEIVAFLSLFLMGGLLLLSLRQRRELRRELARRVRAESALTALNHRLEERVAERTEQLEQQLEACRRAERWLEEKSSQLKRLSVELDTVQDRERRRIAAELHDNLGHSLAIVRNQLELLKHGLLDHEADVVVLDVCEHVSEAIRFSRSLVTDLRSPLAEELPLSAAVRWLADETLDEEIAVHVEVDDEVELDGEEERAVLALALREVFVNVVKHAKATKVEVRVRPRSDFVEVEVTDDGVGFDLSDGRSPTADERSGVGLEIIGERMAQLRGSLSVDSASGRGTRVCLRVPTGEPPSGSRS